LGVQEARALLASSAVLADVREPDELAATGSLKGALNVPLTGLRQMAAHGSAPAGLEAAKERPVILYCRSGRRSDEAGRILLSQGFKRVYNLGGYADAVKAGLPAA
jgi:rhodanese-related sulfurtransferase